MQNHDYENRTELTTKQLKSFVPISEAEHNKFAKIDTIHVLKNGVVVETRKVGRPKKDVAQKENVVSIRLSAFFIQKLKEKAMHEGNLGWQTYIKKVLEQHLNAG